MPTNNNLTEESITPDQAVPVATTPFSSEAEYEMLRAEILQYMEEYQNLRNMMYVGTATLLGLNSAVWANLYLFLLPLIIILPSYILFVDYWKSVSVASIYIQLFLEKDESGKLSGSRKWETMHKKFSAELKKKDNGAICWKRCLSPIWSGMQCHKIPYIVCTILCLAIYGYFVIVGQYDGKAIEMTPTVILGIIALVASLVVFILYRSPNEKTIAEVWEQTRKRMNEEAVLEEEQKSI